MKKLNFFFQLPVIALVLGFTAFATSAQTGSGTVTMSGSVSNYVDLTSGGNATLTGNSGGSVTTQSSSGSQISTVADLGELGPSNSNGFVKLTVPLRIRSNVNYQVSMQATVNSGTATRGITSDDVGFGVGSVTRAGTGVNTTGADAASAADPTAAAGGANATTGRYEFTSVANRLSNYSSSTEVLSGDYVLEPVPSSNTNALSADVYFAVKPQFFEGGSSTSITVTFTATTQP